MNITIILAAVVALGALTGGAYWRGRIDGSNAELATQKREEDVARAATDAAASAVANGLARMEVKNVTITRQLEREVQTREVFRDCRSGEPARQLLNSTPGIASAASAAGGGELSASGAAR